MEKTFVSGETLVGEIVRAYPESVEVLLQSGMHCLGCPASQGESLADACSVHGLDAQQVLERLNRKIADSRK